MSDGGPALTVAPEAAEAPPAARDGEAVGTEARRTRLPAAARPALIYGASLTLWAMAVRLATALQPGLSASVAIGSWDGIIWRAVVDEGYPSSVSDPEARRLAFFPLYPLVVRAVKAVSGLSSLEAGLVVALTCGLAAATALWFLTRSLADEAAADRATALMCCFPGALAFAMPYSEATMLALAIPAMAALLRRRWVLAGALAGLATAARPNAVAPLVGCCAVAAGVALVRHRDWRALAAPVLSVTGVAVFFLFLWGRTGVPLAWFRVQHDVWGERTRPGALLVALRAVVDQPWHPTATVQLIGAAAAVVLLGLLVASRLPRLLWLYCALALVTAAVSLTIMTKPRLVLAAFPLFIGAGVVLRRPAWFAAALAVSSGLAVAVSAFLLASPTTAP